MTVIVVGDSALDVVARHHTPIVSGGDSRADIALAVGGAGANTAASVIRSCSGASGSGSEARMVKVRMALTQSDPNGCGERGRHEQGGMSASASGWVAFWGDRSDSDQ